MTSAFPFPFSLPRFGVIAALVRRDYLVQRSYRLAFVLDLFYGIVNLLVFYFISQTFTDVATADLSGAPSYFAFASIGIAITIVLQAASGGLAHRIREEQLTGTLEALTAQPITVPELSFGLAAFQDHGFRAGQVYALAAKSESSGERQAPDLRNAAGVPHAVRHAEMSGLRAGQGCLFGPSACRCGERSGCQNRQQQQGSTHECANLAHDSSLLNL